MDVVAPEGATETMVWPGATPMMVCRVELYVSEPMASGGVTVHVALAVAAPEPILSSRGLPDEATVVPTAVPAASSTFQPLKLYPVRVGLGSDTVESNGIDALRQTPACPDTCVKPSGAVQAPSAPLRSSVAV